MKKLRQPLQYSCRAELWRYTLSHYVSGGAIQTLAWVRSWARPGPILGPKWSHPDSPCVLFYSVSDPSRSRGGGHPGPSWSILALSVLPGSGLDRPKQTSWPFPKDLEAPRVSQENRATPPEKDPVAPTFSAHKGGVALQVASCKVLLYIQGATTLSPVALQWASK